ncbi:exonuclease domain-containing protein [Litoribacillus peritrichatus]|uniref:DNA-directed DNA polymerase n=1 Tax=Litoribacillus peritrichatus TaxID=718191 RepID=A0ABP7N6E3_9GAMM
MSYRKELPEKYYLQHFEEFIAYISSVCGSLLDDKDKAYLSSYQALPEPAQCLLVRLLNRNITLVDVETLRYDEIPDIEAQLDTLGHAGFIRYVSESDWPLVLSSLNKHHLTQLLDVHPCVSYKKSAKKPELIDLVEAHCSYPNAVDLGLFDNHIVKRQMPVFEYWLFLFFGNLDSRLKQFSMRDLGVIQTRSDANTPINHSARFDDPDAAKSAFIYAKRAKQLKDISDQALEDDLASLVRVEPIVGAQAENFANKYFLKLSRRLEKISVDHAISVLEFLKTPEAEEQWIRLQYKQGKRSEVQARLEHLLDDAQSEHILLFAEDFLARKFNQKKTSPYTDVLRAAKVLSVEELYRNHVELGVQAHYQNSSTEVYFSENNVWRSLFGLLFWEIIFDPQTNVCNEFDDRPQVLIENTFYSLFSPGIEQLLALLGDAQKAERHLTKVASEQYGKHNGLFYWQPDVLESVLCLVRNAQPEPLSELLRLMAKDYYNHNDGFPDLMIVEKGQLRFEEVKAPGDQLRKNQLVMINTLKSCGFDASVTRVEWFIDPSQPYVVVDIETTGGKKGVHRITEIGAVKVVAGEVIDRWQSLINPQRHVPSFITQLTGITNEMVAEAPLFSEVAETFFQFMEGCIFVAHNVNFDYGFIKDEFERVGQRFNMPKLCSCKEMRRHFPGYESYGLANLCREFDINLNSHHRALCDAEAAAELLNLFNAKRLSQSDSKPPK